MESQSAPSSDTKEPSHLSTSISSHTSSKKKIHAFDCAICCESLSKPGPPLECFTFGKLLINFSELSYLERQILYRDFTLADQCFIGGQFDCNKILVTICGHIFHSGCIREWFFMRRMERYPKCPFCNQVTNYEECRILHPLAQDEEEDDDTITEGSPRDKTFNETEYSDISCGSSSWPSDEEVDDTTSEDDDSDHDGTVVVNRGDDLGIPTMNLGHDGRIDFECQDTLCHACRVRAFHNHKNITGILEAALKCNLIHMITLVWLISEMSQRYKIRKAQFEADLERLADYVEDENLAELDSAEMLVPLGYDFMGILAVVGWIVFLCEYICCLPTTRRVR